MAHRLSSIRSVNKIYVLVDGEIAEQGFLLLNKLFEINEVFCLLLEVSDTVEISDSFSIHPILAHFTLLISL